MIESAQVYWNNCSIESIVLALSEQLGNKNDNFNGVNKHSLLEIAKEFGFSSNLEFAAWEILETGRGWSIARIVNEFLIYFFDSYDDWTDWSFTIISPPHQGPIGVCVFWNED